MSQINKNNVINFPNAAPGDPMRSRKPSKHDITFKGDSYLFFLKHTGCGYDLCYLKKIQVPEKFYTMVKSLSELHVTEDGYVYISLIEKHVHIPKLANAFKSTTTLYLRYKIRNLKKEIIKILKKKPHPNKVNLSEI